MSVSGKLGKVLGAYLRENLKEFDHRQHVAEEAIGGAPAQEQMLNGETPVVVRRRRRRCPSRFARLFAGKLVNDLDDFDSVSRIHRCNSQDTMDSVSNNIFYWEPKSLRIRSINIYHVAISEYLPYVYQGSIFLVLVMLMSQIVKGTFNLSRFVALARDPILLELAGIAALIIGYVGRMKPSVYCMDSAVFVPPESWRVTKDELSMMMLAQGTFKDESLEFMRKILATSGTGESTAWPPSIIPSKDGVTKSQTNVEVAREEAKQVIFPLVRDVLKRTGTKPEAVDFLIINCSLFAPTPSLCALVCNEFGMREDIRSYNLGGMGCSANVIAVDLAKQLLQNEPGSRALVISTENLTQNLYKGNEKGMLLQNTLFRCGGCALLLSSRYMDSVRAKYKLLYTFRTQVSEDNSYNCVYQQPDAEGNLGIALSKEIVKVAGRAMKRNFIQLGPYVLPLREQAKVLVNRFFVWTITYAKKAGWPGAKLLEVPQGYTPNFSKGIEHFCIHAGGRAVIEGVQKNLGLSEEQVRPSMQTLMEFGNTSSSSVWYETEWVERHGKMKRGDRILQIAFGSGFKCNSAVWVALRVDKSKCGVPLKADVAGNL